MAQNDPSLTPPVASKFTELWYASTEDTSLKQVFGVQSIPTVISASEDITYRTLESDTEFSVPVCALMKPLKSKRSTIKSSMTPSRRWKAPAQSPGGM